MLNKQDQTSSALNVHDAELGVPMQAVNGRARDSHTEASSLKVEKNPIHLRWRDLGFHVQVPADADGGKGKSEEKAMVTKTILSSISGQVQPGEMLAIMGPSGSGKTSLLNILAQRQRSGVTGELQVNGHQVPHTFKRISGYVTQSDLFFNSLTVRETLTYAARLKLPMSMTLEEKLKRVESVIDDMDLTKVADSHIGEVGHGISGGERRRLAMGIELLNRPMLLMLDEPTSGLDSASALMICRILRRLADRYQTSVICTVHQPRYSVLRMFDNLCLLGNGSTVYFGPTGDECLEFFAANGHRCPKFENPADWMLDLINTKSSDNVHNKNNKNNDDDADDKKQDADEEAVVGVDRDALIVELNKAYVASDVFERAMKPPERMPPSIEADDNASKYVTPWMNQMSTITQRSFYHKMREPISVMTQAFNATILPLLVGTIYWQLGVSQLAVQDRVSGISFMVLLMAFMTFDILLLFPVERDVYLREQGAGLYSTSAFYLGRSMAELPFHCLFAFLAALISYWCFGMQNDAVKFFNFVIIIMSAVLTGSALLIACGAAAKSLDQSNLIATLAIILFMLFDGTWISEDNVPAVYGWIKYLSFMRYSVRSAVKSEFSGLAFTCTPEEAAVFGGTTCPYSNGDDLLREKGWLDVSVFEDVMIMLAMQVLYRTLGYFALRFLHTGKTIKERLQE